MLEQTVKRTIKEYHMLDPGDRVVAAVSGGADSVCLLSLLCRMREECKIEIECVHVHHGLRGEEADRDADFVSALCAELAVPCHIIRIDVREFAARQGMSEEEAGRFLRYEILEREASEWDVSERGELARDSLRREVPEWACLGRESLERDSQERDSKERDSQDRDSTNQTDVNPKETESPPAKIAVAHHSGDQAETILHNLYRGSGLGGLKGISYTRGRIIRPLLDVSREGILEWINKQGLSYVQDSTNASDHYTRNRIRNQLLPQIEELVNHGAAGNIIRLGKLASQADAYISMQAEQWIKKNVSENHGYDIPGEAFSGEPEIIRSYVIMELLGRLAGSSKDLGEIHVQQVMDLAGRQVGKLVNLPYGLCAQKEYDGIRISRRDEPDQKPFTALPQLDIEIFSCKKGAIFPKNEYTKWFDCDRIKGTPEVRTRRPGDYVTLGDGSRKALNRFMIDEKIPRQKRDQIPLLADGSHVMWIIGYRISGFYKINPDTSRVYKAEVKPSGGENNR